ncbi:MAG: hypothetical protein ABJA98_09255 [Acidobacteriota bacterium]
MTNGPQWMVDPTASRRPLVSFVIIGRNDDYMGDYLYRLGTSVSFLADSAERAGVSDAVEVLIVDWASAQALANHVPFGPAARRMTTFYQVAPEVAGSRDGQVRWLPSCAVNVGVRRARGEFIFFTDSDCLWSESALAALGRLLRGEITLPVPIADLFCYVRRYQVPWATVQRRPHLGEWRRLAALLAAGLSPERLGISCLGGFSGGQLMHRDRWFEVRGYDESLDRPWGWHDNDLMLRVSQQHPWLDVSSDGLFGLHMEHWPDADGRRARDASTVNPMVIRNVAATNGPDWGLGEQMIPTAECVSEASSAPGFGCGVPLSGRTAQPLGEGWEPGAEAADFVSRIGAEGESPRTAFEQLATVASIVLRDLPRSFYSFGSPSPGVLLTVLKACPAAELFLVNPWPEGVSDRLLVHPGELARFLEVRCHFRGWARIVQGSPATALERISRSGVGEPLIELAWIGLDTPLDRVRALVDYLAPGGVALCPVEGDPAAALERVRELAPGCVTQLLGRSGLVAFTRPL